jgi:GNAT superfamily N-acetyltransferase
MTCEAATVPHESDLEIVRLSADEARRHVDALAEVLRDCVEGGASVGYLWPFSQAEAQAVYEGYADEVEQGRRLLLAAFSGAAVVGTAQLIFPTHPNQPHRADVARVLVRRSARRRGVARRLMEAVEREAVAAGRTLLVLDTVTGDDAERLYERLGWVEVGVIPNFALYPDGRPCSTTVFYKEL